MRKNFLPLLSLLCLVPVYAQAQHMHDHGDAAAESQAEAEPHIEHTDHAKRAAPAATEDHAQHTEHGAMRGAYGPYSMSREASGTAWVPDSSPMEGIHGNYAGWNTMLHGYASLVYDHQGSKRGDTETFSESMLMGMASRPAGPGTLGLRAMLSLDPLMGKEGYPLLLQTGETADGVNHLIDRQHPHDLLMELAVSYSLPLSDDSSVFVYLGYPGEPALGPPTFMHRFSGVDNPAAPISHHWLDSTHITFGVATAGYVWKNWKLEVSAFNGREPDQFRWNFDPPRLSSTAARLSYNPTPNWALQVSRGFIRSPEQLDPDTNVHRTTASASYNRRAGADNWQTTLAWGRNSSHHGTQDAWLLESAYRWREQHTVFGRAEYVEKNELFNDPDPLAEEVFNVSQLSAGYVYDLPLAEHLKLGLGGVGSVSLVPDSLEPYYGSNTPLSFMLFARVALK